MMNWLKLQYYELFDKEVKAAKKQFSADGMRKAKKHAYSTRKTWGKELLAVLVFLFIIDPLISEPYNTAGILISIPILAVLLEDLAKITVTAHKTPEWKKYTGLLRSKGVDIRD